MTSILAFLESRSGPSFYKSPSQFQAVFASGTTINITGAPFVIEFRHIVGVIVEKDGIASRGFVPWIHSFSWAAGVPGAGVLTIAQGDFDAGETFKVILDGPRAGFSELENADRDIVLNRDVIPGFEKHADIAAGAAVNGNSEWAIVADPWDTFLMSAYLIPGANAGNPVFSITFEGESTDDATAPGAGLRDDITAEVTGGPVVLTEANVGPKNVVSVASSMFGYKRIFVMLTVAAKDLATAYRIESRKSKA